MLGSISQSQIAQVRKELKHNTHIQVREKLSDLKAKNFVPSCFEFFSEFWYRCFILVTFEQLLDSSLDVGLLVTTSMILLFAIMESTDLSCLSGWLVFAFFLPVELEVYISRCGGYRVLVVDKFDD